MLKPLGNRLIVRPEPAATESASGIVFPDTYGKPPAMSGTVVSVGRGPATAHRVRQATIARCVQILNDVADQVPAAALRMEAEDAFARYAVEDVTLAEVSEGDYVAFAYTAGCKMAVDGDELIVMNEDEVQAVWKPEEENVA